MPLVSVMRFGAGGPASIVGATQYISGGPFTIDGPFVLELDPTVFTQAGEYVIFDYSGATSVNYAPYASLQDALDAATIDDSEIAFTAGTLIDYPAQFKVKLVLT